MSKSYDLITFGSGLVDAFLPIEKFEKNQEICFPVGQKIELKEITFSIGGGGINTAICASKLGLSAGFLGKIGKGSNSEIILRELKKSNVDFLGVSSKSHTGYSIILDTNSKLGTILTYKGASNLLSLKEINLKKIKTKWFHFTSMGGQSFKTQLKLIQFAKKNNIKISFNPSMYQIKEKMNIDEIIKFADIISMNKQEARALLRFPYSLKKLCIKIFEKGPSIVCITNASGTGAVFDGENFFKFTPPQINVIESTGAGDIFISTFTTGIIKNYSVQHSLSMAIINTCNLVQHHGGANTGILSLPEILKRIKKTRLNIKKIKITL